MDVVPIRKVFNIIDSCINLKQLKTCESIVDVYIKMIKSQGVVNPSLVRDVLYIRINERIEELNMANNFKGKIKIKQHIQESITV